MTLAFHTMSDPNWTGGEIYLRNLIGALQATHGSRLPLSLLAPAGSSLPEEQPLDRVLRYPMSRPGSPEFFVRKLTKRWLGRDLNVAGVLRRNRISLVFGSMLAWHIPGVATLAMLPDFQHRNYPRLFTAEERERRDHQFAMCAQLATRIVLLSHSAAADHARYLPAFSHKARVLQPVCMLAPGVFAEGPEPLIRRYDLPERFIFCPNQFWQHKNHQLAFEAVRILRDRGVQVHLVCSGNPTDYRHPQHYPAQMNWIESQGLSSHIRHLGLVPLTDVHQLMRQSLAVFSPSRHEGWGMAVDEARSIGKRLLLSEIPAHREQDPPNARYFDPDDAEGLAEAMAWIVAVAEPGPDPRMEHQARQNHAARIACYAQGFLEVAQEAISEVRVDRAPAARSVPD